jgi:hypothetical protein
VFASVVVAPLLLFRCWGLTSVPARLNNSWVGDVIGPCKRPFLLLSACQNHSLLPSNLAQFVFVRARANCRTPHASLSESPRCWLV